MPFIYFSCLIVMSRTSNTVLNKSSGSGYPCLVPGFRGSTFRFSLLNMMLAVDFSYVAFIVLRYVYSISTLLRAFIRNLCWILSKFFSASIEMIMWFLFFSLLMCCIILIDLWILSHPCIPRINPSDHGVWSFNIILDSIC